MSGLVLLGLVAAAQAITTTGLYGQCGGSGVTAACATGVCCTQPGGYYAQCTPAGSTAACSNGAAPTTTSTTPPAKPPTTTTTTTPPAKPPTSTTLTTSTTVKAGAGVATAGVNIAGCDFGIDTSGNSGTPDCPSTVGPTQMQHFVSVDGFNIFRLPVGWQYLTPTLGGTLSSSFFATYDALMQSCLSLSGVKCILDVHNYARWNGGIIGQGGPTNAQFTSLWTQLATKYATKSNVIFGIMNEPHDLNMSEWAATVQQVVTAIRAAGATSQLILLPGTSYTGASVFATQSAPYLSTIKDSDGTTTKLIYDVHQYYDSDGSGTQTTCTNNHVSDFNSLGTYLRTNGRKALFSETGGANAASCYTIVCQGLAAINSNSDVFLGWVGWAAGSFDPSYVDSEVPSGTTDAPLVQTCIAGEFHK